MLQWEELGNLDEEVRRQGEFHEPADRLCGPSNRELEADGAVRCKSGGSQRPTAIDGGCLALLVSRFSSSQERVARASCEVR